MKDFLRNYWLRVMFAALVIGITFCLVACKNEDDSDKQNLFLLLLLNRPAAQTGWTITIPSGVPL